MENREAESETPFEIPAKPGVKVYGNPYGMVIVKNFDDANRSEENEDLLYVMIHPNDAEKVAKWIVEMANVIKQSMPKDMEPGYVPEFQI